MSESLPVIFTKNFEQNLKSIPQHDKKKILYNLTHMNKQDAFRVGYFKGDLNHVKKLRVGDYRVILGYCADCYLQHKEYLNCSICNENDLERIVAFFVYPRKKLYKSHKINLSKIEF